MKKGLNAQFHCLSSTKPDWKLDDLENYGHLKATKYYFSNSGWKLHILKSQNSIVATTNVPALRAEEIGFSLEDF